MLSTLNDHSNMTQDKLLDKAFAKIQNLISALNQREVPVEIENRLQATIEALNAFEGRPKARRKHLQKGYNQMVKLLQKELGWVPKGYYRTLWMSLGMAVFGIPIGLAFSAVTDNYGLLGIGIPLGVAIGLAVGSGLDDKAVKEGKQLEA